MPKQVGRTIVGTNFPSLHMHLGGKDMKNTEISGKAVIW
jgi:hypothetical protein